MRFDPALVWAAVPTSARDDLPLARALGTASTQYGFITFDQAIDAGLSPSQIRGLVRRGVWRREHRGLYAVAGSSPSPGQRPIAPVLASGGRALVSHRSALWLWGVAGRDLEIVACVAPFGIRLAMRGAVFHRAVTST